ncbi:MAG: DUF3857 domain-containing transglutaminase family protein [Candidatus Cloacimonetes bacterium]|nr:DUF3857 domain-containing transglutaminase family protein [Candidatus Cloacimonadota bacterium]MBL7085752.1 DUF3857 domain-containing transglutaminase family protein [Candidatus Cloacimonadota bacterium]
MKKYILVVFLLATIFPNLSEAKEYPNASGVVLLDSTTITLDKDMKVDKERFLRIKILEKRGRDVFGDIKERYDKNSQDFQVITAQTILPSGRTVKADKDAISDVSAPEVGFATQYTNVLMKVVSFSALEPDVIIEYHYKVSSKEATKHPLFGEVLFQGTEPIKKKVFTIVFPLSEESKFHQEFIGGDIEPIIKHLSDDMVSYKFIQQDIPKIETEPNMPPIPEIAPKLLFTFYDSWEEFGKWYGEKFYKSAKTNKSIKKLAEELGGKTKEEQIENIVLFIQQKIRSVYLSFGESGYKPNKAKKVLKNRYGDPQDKAVLLVSLLKAAGINAYPVLVPTPKWGYFSIVGLSRSILADMNNSLPVPSQFNSVMVAIENNGDIQFVSPIGQFNRYGWIPTTYQGKDGLMIRENISEFVNIPILNEKESIVQVFLNAEIDEQGNLSGTFELKATGYCDRNIRNQLKFKNKDEQDIFFASLVDNIRGGSKLISYDFTDAENLTKDMFVKVIFESPHYATFQGEKVRFNIPKLSIYGANVGNYSSIQKRNYDLRLYSKRMYSYEEKIIIPETFEVEYIPNSRSKDNEYAEFEINSNKDNNELTFISNFILKDRNVNVSDYKEFKKLQDEYFNRNKWMVILTK